MFSEIPRGARTKLLFATPDISWEARHAESENTTDQFSPYIPIPSTDAVEEELRGRGA